MNSFYVYAHRTNLPRSLGDVFYIGKGQRRRAWTKWGHNQRWENTAKKYGYSVEILIDGLSESEAFVFEKFFISFCGRNQLCNMTDGGEGASGSVHSEETKNKISKKNKGLTRSPEFCARMKIHNGKRNTSEEQRSKVAAANATRIVSKETRDKISAALSERVIKKETIAKLSRCVICSNGEKFSSQSEATRWLRTVGFDKACSNNISNVCQRKRGTAYGLGWSYAE